MSHMALLARVMLHYTGGVWNVDRHLPKLRLGNYLDSVGQRWLDRWRLFDEHYKSHRRRQFRVLRPFLWRLTTAPGKDAPVPNPHGYSSLVGRIQNIQMLSATEGWMIGGIDSAAQAISATCVCPPKTLRLPFAKRSVVAVPMPANLPCPYNADEFAYVSPDEFWAMGDWGISHYYKGVWKNVV